MATINDIVLVYLEEKPLFFARIEDISPDHKKDWYHVTLLVLQVPVQTVTWILRDAYIDGEGFTMGGNPMRIEKVEAPVEDWPIDEGLTENLKEKSKKAGKPGKAEVIAFNAIKPEKK